SRTGTMSSPWQKYAGRQLATPAVSRLPAEPGSRQSGAAEPFQIMFPVGLVPPRQLGRDPRQRDIRLGTAKLGKGHFGHMAVAAHARGHGKHAVGAGEIAAMADRLTRQRDRFSVSLRHEPRI